MNKLIQANLTEKKGNPALSSIRTSTNRGVAVSNIGVVLSQHKDFGQPRTNPTTPTYSISTQNTLAVKSGGKVKQIDVRR